MTKRASDAGVAVIRDFEGFRGEAYICPGGKWTIGYGHQIQPGEAFDSVTVAQAEALLRQDVAIAEKAVNRLVTVPLTQGQFDALVSFTFNLGAGKLETSTLLRYLNAGAYEAAARQLDLWVWGGPEGAKEVLPGLVRRRAAEREMFLPPPAVMLGPAPASVEAGVPANTEEEMGEQTASRVPDIGIALRKFLKGTGGALAIFALVRLIWGREAGWGEVTKLQLLLDGLIAALFGAFEAGWGVVKFLREPPAAPPASPRPNRNFTHKDDGGAG